MRTRVLLAVFAALLLVPSAAFASLAGEQRQGGQLLAQLKSGAKACSDLSAEDFDHIGEYAIGRALGSTSTHQAMNDRMRLMLGDQGEQRMHERMGRRFAGCGTRGNGGGYGSMMGGGMMNHHGWSAWAVVALTLGAVLLVALLVALLVRHPFRGPPAPAN
jgi:hypothetical protein